MKQLFLTLVFLISIVFNSFSQNDDSGNLIYPNNFIISSHSIVNGKITYEFTPLTVKGSFGMTVTDIYKPYFSEIKTAIYLVKLDGSSADLLTTGPTFTKADFIVSGYTYNFSKIKEFSINIPGSFQFDLGTYKLAVLYQYHFNPSVNLPNLTTAGWAPTVTHGKEWYTHNKTYGFSRQIPPTTISGPGTLCDEGTYTVINPGTITLENAAGIATLTELGNNQWKVTRIGSAEGTVYLKSSIGVNIYNFPIEINSEMKGTMTGPGGIKQGMSGTITFTPLTGNNYTNLAWTVDAGAHTSLQIDPYNLKITIPPNYPLYDTYNGDDVIVTVKGNGECGLMEKKYVLRILPRQPSPNPQQ